VLFYSQYRKATLTGRWPDDGWFLYLAQRVAEVERQCQTMHEVASYSNLLSGTQRPTWSG
jgi:hypothetical protein